MSETYSIPTSPTAFFDYEQSIISYCGAAAARLTLPAAKITAIAAKQATYETAYRVTANPSTQNPLTTADRDQKASDLKLLLVDLFDHNILNNTLLTDADRVALHINKTAGRGGSVIPAPANAPIIALVTEEQGALHVIYSDPGAPGTHYKPAGVAFCELAYKVGDPAPTKVADCPERHNITRSHEPIAFEQQQRGSKIHAYARWVNKNGKQGPWSSLVSTIIP